MIAPVTFWGGGWCVGGGLGGVRNKIRTQNPAVDSIQNGAHVPVSTQRFTGRLSCPRPFTPTFKRFLLDVGWGGLGGWGGGGGGGGVRCSVPRLWFGGGVRATANPSQGHHIPRIPHAPPPQTPPPPPPAPPPSDAPPRAAPHTSPPRNATTRSRNSTRISPRHTRNI